MNGRYLSELDTEDVTIVRILEERAARSGSDLFFTWDDTRVTVDDFNQQVNAMARNLADLGVTRGTHVLVLMNNSPQYLATWFAIAKLGAVEVPVNTAYHGAMLEHQITTAEVTFAIVDEHYAPRLAQLGVATTSITDVVVRGNRPSGDSFRWHDFTVLERPNDTSNLGIDIPFDSVAGIIFTSGTTGPSKGVILTHHYLAAYGLMYAEVNQLGRDDVLLNFLPFFHVSGKFLTIATLGMNARMRLQPRLSVSTFWDEIRRYGVTNFIGVGGVCNMLLAQAPKPDDAQTSVRTVYAVPDPTEIHQEFEDRFGCHMTTVFGSTEAGLPIFRRPTDDYMPGSCGRQSPYYEVKIVDERDREVPTGQIGEIVVRSKLPYLLGAGYIGMPEHTVEAWRNLWFHTGDRGRVDADGWFWFEDRASDSLRRRGENISSYEVETLVCRHPAVAEAVAVAAPSSVGEDEVWVLAKLREGAHVEPAELLAHCATVMPYFMIPRFFEIVDDFPRTPTAKIEKYKLRQAGPGASAWDREAHGWHLRRRELVFEPEQAVGGVTHA
ncbi:ATP-dependent acyl-CoA ligase [Rhodococcus sp. WS4]|nr:ATP-dependent acyl-CoA ligase [Rhodococcus sp. WS4]